jgi:hypothetical protein
MVFVRGRPPESSVWQKFRSGGDGFVFGTGAHGYEVRLQTNADRAVELFLALAEQMAPALDVWLDDCRVGQVWRGEALANADVRDAVARVKGALTTFGGVDVSLVAPDEQLTLTANLALYVYSRSDRWLYLLQGMGLRRVAGLRPRSWELRRGEFAASAEAATAVRLTAERLGLAAEPAEGHELPKEG